MMLFWLITLLLGLFWGGSYLAIRWVVVEVPPLTGALIRILIATFLSLLLILGRRQPRTSWRLKSKAMIVGIFMMGFSWALLFWAEQWVLPSLAALTISSIPIFTQLLGPILTPEDHYPHKLWLGIGTGFLGVFLLLLPSLRSPDFHQMIGAVAVLVVALCYAIATLGVRRLSPYLSIPTNLFYQCVGATLFLIPVVLFKETVTPWDWSGRVWISLLYLGVCSTFIAWLVYFYVIRRFGATLASVVPYFPPLVSLLLDRIFLGKLPPLVSILGGMVILTGVYLTQRHRYR